VVNLARSQSDCSISAQIWLSTNQKAGFAHLHTCGQRLIGCFFASEGLVAWRDLNKGKKLEVGLYEVKK